MRSLILLISLSFLCAGPAVAKSKKKFPPAPKIKPMTEAQFKKALKKAKRTYKVRKFASTATIDESKSMSDSYRTLRSKFIGGPTYKDGIVDKSGPIYPGVNSAHQLHEFLVELEKEYDSYAPDAKLVAAQFLTLKPFKGILYRFRPVVEKHRVTHSTLVTMFRGMQTGVNLYFPDKQWQAGYDYLAHPGKDYTDNKAINNDVEFRLFVAYELIPSVEKFIDRMESLNLGNDGMYYDNKLLYKSAQFVEAEDRYTRVVQSDIVGFKGVAHITLAGLLFSSAYTWDGFFDTMDDLWKKFGISAVLDFDDVEGATAKERVNLIRRKSSLFRLDSGADNYTTEAYNALSKGFKYMRLSWAAKGDFNQKENRTVNVGSNSEFGQFGGNLFRGTPGFTNFFDPRALLPFNRAIGLSYDNIERLLREDPVNSALINGEVRQVKYKTFFTEPIADLKLFLPIGFNENVEQRIACPSKPSIDDCHNYMYNIPTKWDYDAYHNYFPQVKNMGKYRGKNYTTDVKVYGRILGQLWGGQIVAIPMTAALF